MSIPLRPVHKPITGEKHNYTVSRHKTLHCLTYEFISDTASLLEVVVTGDEDAVDKRHQRCFVRHQLRGPQLRHQQTEPVPQLLHRLAKRTEWLRML